MAAPDAKSDKASTINNRELVPRTLGTILHGEENTPLFAIRYPCVVRSTKSYGIYQSYHMRRSRLY